MTLGAASTIRTAELLRTQYTDIDTLLNEWLYMNPDKTVIDIQYYGKSVLVIYRIERG